MGDNEATVAQRIAFLEGATEKRWRDADESEAQLVLTPADEHLHKRLIALRKMADDTQSEIERLRDDGEIDE
jgi:hypothetical protein